MNCNAVTGLGRVMLFVAATPLTVPSTCQFAVPGDDAAFGVVANSTVAVLVPGTGMTVTVIGKRDAVVSTTADDVVDTDEAATPPTSDV